ncbi:MAG TPA: hypothetical protein VH187_13515 [Scandinavium sp.]|jgi:hypothetical protein|uniref:hypothetical protein n=1 Tax=Scandinavium sp. TaxID=2830653 RepID=UPI002E35C6BB|nr:hypothetical protein [Scandinavium sp.]HEX4502149.1 hypothetical protein [Scandinavium sp.]
MTKYRFTISGEAETVDEEGNPKEPGGGLDVNAVIGAIEEVINDNDLGVYDEENEEIFLEVTITLSDASELTDEIASS